MWKEIYGFEDYLINSETQEIKSKDRYKKIIRDGKEYKRFFSGQIMRQYTDRCGYLTTRLSKNKKRKTVFVHVLMMRTFNPVPNMEKLEVNHIDHNKLNNNLDNLEWCTHKENVNKMVDFYTNNPDKKPSQNYLFNKEQYCKKCREKLSGKKSKTGLCEKCYQDNIKVVFDNYVITSKGKITKDELYQLLKENSFCAVGRIFNVSDNTIRKWCRGLNIPYKAKDYK